jgi:uncharacterized protein
MLLRFACSNFKSIKDRQEILFTAAKGVKNLPDAPRTVEGYKKNQLLPVIAVYGANASGKSNMLEALAFIKRAALRSHVDWENGIPRKPFRLDPACVDLPSTFDIDFLIGSTRYHYGFSIDDEKVLEEWLYAVKPGRKQQVWFERKAGEKVEYGGTIRTQGEALEKLELSRENVLIISLLMQSMSHPIGEVHSFFRDLISYFDHFASPAATIDLFKDAEIWGGLESVIVAADTGIEGLTIAVSEKDQRVFNKKEQRDWVRELVLLEDDLISQLSGCIPVFSHQSGDSMVHFMLPDESRGTGQLYRLAGAALMALRAAKCLCVDELETSLHPLLSRAIIRLFMDPKTNPKGAQLFFTTHDKSLLGKEVLRRDQVWLTEKDRVGATHVYPLSDFDINDDTDLESAYLEGRFGGVPFVRNLLSTTAS